MSDINSVVVAGRLTRDVAVSYLPNGTPKGEFSIAVNRSVKVGDGWQNEPSFLDVVSFGKRVENQKLNMTRGVKVCVSGSIRQDRWQDQNGQNRSKIYIVADTFEVIGGVRQQGNGFQEDIPFNGF